MSTVKAKIAVQPVAIKLPKWRLHQGDCTRVLRRWHKQERKLFDVVICDPPYNLASIVKRFGKTSVQDKNKTGERAANRSDGYARLARGFMGHYWDNQIAFDPKTWARVFAMMKPGAYLIAMGGSRTSHRMTVAIEDAGFIIRDTYMWLHGQGFPKSHNISKAIDKLLGKSRKVIGKRKHPTLRDKNKMQRSGKNHFHGKNSLQEEWTLTAPSSELAQLFDGYGTAAKPAYEPIIIAQKPIEGTIAANIVKFGTGGINIEGARVPYSAINPPIPQLAKGKTTLRKANVTMYDGNSRNKSTTAAVIGDSLKGRWPANVIHDGSPEVLEAFAAFGESRSSDKPRRNTADAHNRTASMGKSSGDWITHGHSDAGTAARFFYCAKTSKKERVFFCTRCEQTFFREKFPRHQHKQVQKTGKPDFSHVTSHPTVKPLALMKYLVKLFTPPNGRVLDPFAGSGTTLEAAMLSGFRAVGIEQHPEYIRHIKRRMRRSTL